MNSKIIPPRQVWRAPLSLLLAFLGLIVGCKRESSDQPSSASSAPAYFKTPLQDESQFIVENIVKDIAEMAFFASHHSAPDSNLVSVDARENGGAPDAPSYDITVKIANAAPVQSKLTLSGPIWSETVYGELAGAIAASMAWSSPSAAIADDTGMLGRLTDGSAETLAREDLSLSANLQTDFSNPAWHEEAAALLGAFALRENSGPFFDIRLPLCRMTAHLALARFLAGDHPPGPNGRVADCLLLTLMNDETDALAQIQSLDTSDKAVAAWAQTLRAYASRDFRPLDSFTNVPGIQQVAWFWAYSSVNNRAVAWGKIGADALRVPDFSRISAAMGYSVEMGNAMLQAWLPLEIQEIRKVYGVTQARELQQTELVAALNAEPGRCFESRPAGPPRVRVIGWGLWALQLQHHFCQAISADFGSLRYKLGLPDDAWSFAKQCEDNYGGLRFYPFVRRIDCTNNETYRKSIDQGWAFESAFPQLTPLDWMVYLAGKVSFAPRYYPIPNPHCNEWTSHNPLPGTAYELDTRLDFPSFIGGVNGNAKVQKAHEMAPYDIALCKYIGRSYSTNWTYDAASSTFGPLLPYSATAAACIADSLVDQPDQYEKTMEQAVKWDPSFYWNLAEYEWNHGQTNEAMTVYEKDAERNPDAIQVASLAGRRIQYYLATGQKEKARQTADFAGDVYSASGLSAKAWFLEKTGDLPGAFDWYNKINERYNRPTDALLFSCRHLGTTGDADLEKSMSGLLKDWFHRQKKVSLSDFSGPPADGVTLDGGSAPLEKAGLKKGDIVVAARRLPIHNTTQLTIARDMDLSPDLDVIVWQDGRYREAKVVLPPNHRFGVMVLDYKPAK